jgi:small GTP-binding protein
VRAIPPRFEGKVIAMPMPHRTQMQVIKRRLVGKEGGERIKELRAILAELPGYRSGPYADIRKWVTSQIEEARVRKKTVHRDSIAVRRDGVAQIALVGPPNAGKSSLLQALSSIQIKTGDYAFTTTRPVPSIAQIHGLPVQLVEIPGLIEGAADDRGGGRALLGVLRGADAMVLCQEATAPLEALHAIRAELAEAGIEKRALVAVTKLDEAAPSRVDEVARATGLPAVGVSVLDDESLERFSAALWSLTGLIRVFLRRPGFDEAEPRALEPGSTVVDAAQTVHHELAAACAGARVWGPSAKFDGQRVGREHMLAEGDTVAIV